jgi:hypothetical protein
MFLPPEGGVANEVRRPGLNPADAAKKQGAQSCAQLLRHA